MLNCEVQDCYINDSLMRESYKNKNGKTVGCV